MPTDAINTKSRNSFIDHKDLVIIFRVLNLARFLLQMLLLDETKFVGNLNCLHQKHILLTRIVSCLTNRTLTYDLGCKKEIKKEITLVGNEKKRNITFALTCNLASPAASIREQRFVVPAEIILLAINISHMSDHTSYYDYYFIIYNIIS